MNSVAVNENAVGGMLIVGIAAIMGALVDEQNLLPGAGEAFGNDAAGEAGADDAVVNIVNFRSDHL